MLIIDERPHEYSVVNVACIFVIKFIPIKKMKGNF